MLKIRLRRTGAKKQPRYRVVVADSRAPRDGAFVEVIGWYNPQTDPAQVVVDTEKADAWLRRGAQPSDRVAYLLKQARLGVPITAAQAPAEAPAEPPAEAPAEAPKPRGRGRGRAASAASEPTAGEPGPSEAPESEGSAASAVASDVSPSPESAESAPESEGSAGLARE